MQTNNHQSINTDDKSFDWVYMLLCCIILNKVDMIDLFKNDHYVHVKKLTKNIQNEFRKLIFDTKFLHSKLSQPNFDNLIEYIFNGKKDENKSRLELNNL